MNNELATSPVHLGIHLFSYLQYTSRIYIVIYIHRVARTCQSLVAGISLN